MVGPEMDSLKKEILDLLDRDVEFRYAVAGYLGLSEILKRLDNLAEQQVKLGKEQTRLAKEQAKLAEEQVKLRSDFNEMLKEVRSINVRLMRVERTLEKLTLDIEDEARAIISHRIKEELGLEMKLTSLMLPDVELNIYGTSDDVCVIGEASVRAGVGLVDDLLKKMDMLRKNHPDKLKDKVILVIYASLPMPELVERAVEKRIWVLKATEDIVKLSLSLEG